MISLDDTSAQDEADCLPHRLASLRTGRRVHPWDPGLFSGLPFRPAKYYLHTQKMGLAEKCYYLDNFSGIVGV